MFRPLADASTFILETRNRVRRTQVHQGGLTLSADVHSFRAPWFERATSAGQGRVRGIAKDHRQPRLTAASAFIENRWNGPEESFCVRMLGRREHGCSRTTFDDLAAVKDQNTISKAGEQSWVVRDEDHRETQFFPERSKHPENFHLCGGIERRGRFIGDHHGRTAGDRLRDQHTLPLSSTELMWIRARNAIRLFRKNLCENLTRPFVQHAFFQGTVRGQHLANLFADAHGWMECKGRFLENQRNAPATDLLQFVRLGLQKILPFKMDSPANDLSIPGKEPHKRYGERAFARSGFAEDAHDLAGHEIKTDAG